MNRAKRFLLSLTILTISGCATIPLGPRTLVLPGPGKSFETFQSDDQACRLWAERQLGIKPDEALNHTMASGAAIGTMVGAGLGAAIGSASGQAGSGAAIGALGGFLGGTALAADSAYAYNWEWQRRYDIAYQQCMYAKGNQIPGVGRRPKSTIIPPPPPPGSNPKPSARPLSGIYPPPPPPSPD